MGRWGVCRGWWLRGGEDGKSGVDVYILMVVDWLKYIGKPYSGYLILRFCHFCFFSRMYL